MTHLVTPKLGELIRNGGTLLMETPLFLLQVPSISYPQILLIFSFFYKFQNLTDQYEFLVDGRTAGVLPRKGQRACRRSWTGMFELKL